MMTGFGQEVGLGILQAACFSFRIFIQHNKNNNNSLNLNNNSIGENPDQEEEEGDLVQFY